MVDTASLVSGDFSSSSSPQSTLSGLCKPRFFLDIFSGARLPVSTACKQFSVDMFDPVDLIHGWDILDDGIFHSLLCLSESGLVGAALAAPYCCKHSRATLRRPGPRPVRTPEYLDGLPDNTVQQQLAVQESATVHDRARHLLSAVARSNGLIILEKPFLQYDMVGRLYATLGPHHCTLLQPMQAHASLAPIGAKTWCFVSNKPVMSPSFVTTGLSPMNLWLASDYLMAPSNRDSLQSIQRHWQPLWPRSSSSLPHVPTGNCPLDSWRNLLPPKLAWPLPGRRVEDGGGLTSSALCTGSLSIQPWPLLRKRWFQRLCDSKHCFKIMANIQQGLHDPPLSQEELQPYLDDLLGLSTTGRQGLHHHRPRSTLSAQPVATFGVILERSGYRLLRPPQDRGSPWG